MLVKSSVQPVTTLRLIIQVVPNAIARFVMLVKTFYFPVDVLLVLLQVKVTKLDRTCLVGLILSSFVLFVKNVIDSVSVQPSILDAGCPTIRATLKNKNAHLDLLTISLIIVVTTPRLS